MLPIVTVEGRMVTDPELRFSPSGIAVGKFRIVADQKKKTESGEWVDDKTLWLQVTVFKQLAENCVDSLTKGDLVMVTGKLETDEWETEGGEKRSTTVLVANNVAPSLLFRSVPHGEQRRAERTSAPAQDDAWSTPKDQPEDPPF